MKKKDLFKAIIAETVNRNLAEMPQIKKFYTLTDEWEENLNKIDKLKNSPNYREIKSKIESFRNKDYFNTDDIMRSFGFQRPQSSNAFLKVLVDNGVAMRTSKGVEKQQVDIDADDEWSFEVDPTSDLFGSIDIESTLNKINLDKQYRVLEFKWIGKNSYGYPIATYTFRTTRYRFLKPFLEGGYYKDIPKEDIVKFLQPQRWSSPEINVLDLFPSQKDFYKFLQENPSVIKQASYNTQIPPVNTADSIKITARKG
jgi:hypothetical protein